MGIIKIKNYNTGNIEYLTKESITRVVLLDNNIVLLFQTGLDTTVQFTTTNENVANIIMSKSISFDFINDCVL